nr:truncated cytochrome P450 monooxygenase OlcM' [Aspergillus felis]
MPLISFEPIVILPQEHIKWIIDQPPTVLCPRRAAYTRMGVRYVAPGFTPAISEILHSAIKIHLNKKFDNLKAEMYDQLSWAIDRSFGTADGVSKVSLSHAIRYTVYHTLVPVLAGRELAKNASYRVHSGLGRPQRWLDNVYPRLPEASSDGCCRSPSGMSRGVTLGI